MLVVMMMMMMMIELTAVWLEKITTNNAQHDISAPTRLSAVQGAATWRVALRRADCPISMTFWSVILPVAQFHPPNQQVSVIYDPCSELQDDGCSGNLTNTQTEKNSRHDNL